MIRAESIAGQEMGITPEEITAMACALARRYGSEAAGVALHFAAEHRAVRDPRRERVWIRVAHRLRQA